MRLRDGEESKMKESSKNKRRKRKKKYRTEAKGECKSTKKEKKHTYIE